MKKIMALAVASAFAVPAFAADVTISGDVEYVFSNQTGVTAAAVGDADFNISATEEIGDITVTAYLDDEQNDMDSALVISGSFGTVSVGDDIGSAVGSFDEITDKAEKGGDIDDAGNAYTEIATVKWALPLAVEGLDVHISYGAAAAADDATVLAYAAQYTTGGLTLFAGTDSANAGSADTEEVGAYGVSYTYGPVYVAYESVDNLDGVVDDEMSAVAVSYTYGPGKITYESGDTKDASASTENEKTAISINYAMGALNTYVATSTTTTAGTEADDITYIGVEYAF